MKPLIHNHEGVTTPDVPTLDDLAREPELASKLSVEEIAALAMRMSAAAMALGTAIAAVHMPRSEPTKPVEPAARPDESVWLTTTQVVQRWPGIFSKDYLYRHGNLPFVHRLSPRKNVYSEAGILRWLATRPKAQSGMKYTGPAPDNSAEMR